MKTIKNVVKFLNILVFLYALLGIWLVINWLFIPASKDILYELISRNFLLVLFGIVSVVKITDAIIGRVFPVVRPEMYSSKSIYDLGVFYFEFLTIIFLFPTSENSIKIILYFIIRYFIIKFIAEKIIKKRTPFG